VSIGVRDVSARFRVAVPEARIVRDRHGNRGPIEGLRRGTSVARGDVVLVAPADAPLLQPALYVALLRVLGDHDAAVSRPSVFDPLRAVYRRGAVLRALRASGDAVGSPSALVDRLDAVFLEGAALRDADPTLSSFIDVNRREDLEHALRVATPPIGVATPS
jgi:molybdopterin-guanine dinucleotide biosynthesis protein A